MTGSELAATSHEPEEDEQAEDGWLKRRARARETRKRAKQRARRERIEMLHQRHHELAVPTAERGIPVSFEEREQRIEQLYAELEALARRAANSRTRALAAERAREESEDAARMEVGLAKAEAQERVKVSEAQLDDRTTRLHAEFQEMARRVVEARAQAEVASRAREDSEQQAQRDLEFARAEADARVKASNEQFEERIRTLEARVEELSHSEAQARAQAEAEGRALATANEKIQQLKQRLSRREQKRLKAEARRQVRSSATG
jgi:hypothetical protein